MTEQICTNQLFCLECGSDLTESISTSQDGTVFIAPCESCLKLAEKEGYDDGYIKGYDTARTET